MQLSMEGVSAGHLSAPDAFFEQLMNLVSGGALPSCILTNLTEVWSSMPQQLSRLLRAALLPVQPCLTFEKHKERPVVALFSTLC